MDFAPLGSEDQSERARRRQYSEAVARGVRIGGTIGGITGIVLGIRRHCNENCTNGGPVLGVCFWGAVGALAGGAIGGLIGSRFDAAQPQQTSTLASALLRRVATAQLIVAPADRGKAFAIGLRF